jgi:hypothetical protein
VLEDGRVRRGAAVVCLSWPGKLGTTVTASGEGYLDIVRVERNGLVRICNCIAIRFELDVCLAKGVSRRECAADGRLAAYLGTICVERRLLVPQFYGLGVEVERSGPVLVLESFIALVFELGGFFLWAAHDACRQVRDTKLGWTRHDGTIQERATGGCSCRLVNASSCP